MSSLIKLSWIAAAAVLPLLVGCAGEAEERPGAAYPEVVGSDTPEQMAAASEAPPQPIQNQLEPAPQEGVGPGQEISVGADGNDYADTDPSALSDFRSTLDPYGNWVEDPNYGTVWVPSPSVVGTDFAPYVTNGYWTYDNDYTWVSGYEWGWAPFHYGRWAYLGSGWGWIPGRRYAGAWVGWRTGYDYYDGYVGWAPLPPTWYWHGGWALGLGVVPRAPYAFCSGHDLFAPQLAGRIVTGGAVAAVGEHSRPYVPATPGVGGTGHTAASPGIGGPPPSQLHIPANQIAHTPVNDRGIIHAQQFSRPNTALAMGARAPTQLGGAMAGRPFASGGAAGNGMASANVGAHGFASASAPHGIPGGAVAGHALLPRPAPTMPAYGARAGGFSGPTRIGGGAETSGSYSHSTYGGPSYHSGPAYSGSSAFHSGSSFSGGGSAFHSGPTYSAPSSHYSGGGGFSGGSSSHFSGGGGGHYSGGGSHGGGGGHGGGHR